MQKPGLSTFSQLDHRARLQLMRFVCSFAWADLEVRSAEQSFVTKIMERLDLSKEERKKVATWLKVPPPPEEVDPALVPLDRPRRYPHRTHPTKHPVRTPLRLPITQDVLRQVTTRRPRFSDGHRAHRPPHAPAWNRGGAAEAGLLTLARGTANMFHR